jgi:hypothetical protein
LVHPLLLWRVNVSAVVANQGEAMSSSPTPLALIVFFQVVICISLSMEFCHFSTFLSILEGELATLPVLSHQKKFFIILCASIKLVLDPTCCFGTTMKILLYIV